MIKKTCLIVVILDIANMWYNMSNLKLQSYKSRIKYDDSE